MAKDNPATNPSLEKTRLRTTRQSSSPGFSYPTTLRPRRHFPIKSLALSAHVSPQTIHVPVSDKSPVSGSGRGPPFCNRQTDEMGDQDLPAACVRAVARGSPLRRRRGWIVGGGGGGRSGRWGGVGSPASQASGDRRCVCGGGTLRLFSWWPVRIWVFLVPVPGPSPCVVAAPPRRCWPSLRPPTPHPPPGPRRVAARAASHV